MRCRRVKTLVLTAAGALLLAGPALLAQGVFPDKNLEAVVRPAVSKKRATQEPLTADDVREVARIDARAKGIKDLTGLDQCIGVEFLDLSGNEISDLTPLAKLGTVRRPYAASDDAYVQYMDLSKNKITDLQPLAGFVKVQYLNLNDNQITDLSPLAKLRSLNSLHLSNNKIKDLTPVAGLERLWTLAVDGNAISDLKAIAKLKFLASLDLRGNPAADAATLAALTQLHDVFLDANRFRDLTPLVKAAQKDFETEKSFVPFLRIYFNGTPLPAVKAQLAALGKLGVQVIALPRSDAPASPPAAKPTPAKTSR